MSHPHAANALVSLDYSTFPSLQKALLYVAVPEEHIGENICDLRQWFLRSQKEHEP